MRYVMAAARLIAIPAAALFVLAACTQRDAANQDSLTQAKAAGTVPDIKVAEVQLGKSIGADMKVTTPMTEFAAKDTIYVSVSTTGMSPDASLLLLVSPLAGAPDSTNSVRDNKTVSPSGPQVTEFHFFKPAGMKVGKYKAEVFLNGGLADVKEFEIVKPK